MGWSEVDFGNGEIWRGDDSILLADLCDDIHPYISSRVDSLGTKWLFKGNYMTSWRDVRFYYEMDELTELRAGPRLKVGRFRREGTENWEDIYLEETIELIPHEASKIYEAMEVQPLWKAGPKSTSVHSAILASPNLTWRNGQPPPVETFHSLLDTVSFQRCALAHLIYHRSTNLADILLRVLPEDPNKLQLVLGDAKKCFWPSSSRDFFWIRYENVFGNLTQLPLDPSIRALASTWDTVHLPEDLPLRSSIAHRLKTIATLAQRADAVSIATISDFM